MSHKTKPKQTDIAPGFILIQIGSTYYGFILVPVALLITYWTSTS